MRFPKVRRRWLKYFGPCPHSGMRLCPGEVIGEVFGHCNRADSRAPSPVGDTKCFVKVEVAYIHSHLTGEAKTNEGIEVGSIHIDLPPVFVNDFANIPKSVFKNTMCGGVGDHKGGKVVFMFLRFGFEVLEVDIALRVALNHNHFHSRHDRAGGIGSMGGTGNEADVSVSLVLNLMVLANDKKAS